MFIVIIFIMFIIFIIIFIITVYHYYYFFPVLLPRMCRLAMDGRHSEEEWLVLGLCLLEAYSTLTCCQLPDHVIAHFVLPPLNQVSYFICKSYAISTDI